MTAGVSGGRKEGIKGRVHLPDSLVDEAVLQLAGPGPSIPQSTP